MNILFHSNQIGEAGTEVALFDYAMGNKRVLGNSSYIASPSHRVRDDNVLERFSMNFDVCLYKNGDELEFFLREKKIDLIYRIEDGRGKEPLPVKGIPLFIHCVFSTQTKHGAFYCPISEFLNKWFRTNYTVLPHIVNKFPGNTDNLRKKLNIPDNATVFGFHGGKDSFNISFVHQCILETAKKRKDIYFLFLNIRSFTPAGESYENIIFLPKNTDMVFKEVFINTCNAMIHARSNGETFGLSIAEFSIKNKPVITYAPGLKYSFKEWIRYNKGKNYKYARAHLDFLGDKAITYKSKKNLLDILNNFETKYFNPSLNYDCYSERFNEEKVMNIFKEIISQYPN